MSRRSDSGPSLEDARRRAINSAGPGSVVGSGRSSATGRPPRVTTSTFPALDAIEHLAALVWRSRMLTMPLSQRYRRERPIDPPTRTCYIFAAVLPRRRRYVGAPKQGAVTADCHRGLRRRRRGRRRLAAVGAVGNRQPAAGRLHRRRPGDPGDLHLQPRLPELQLLRRLLERHPAVAAGLLVGRRPAGPGLAALLAGRDRRHVLGGAADRKLGATASPACTTKTGATRCCATARGAGSSSPTSSVSTWSPPCRCSSACCRSTSRSPRLAAAWCG